MKSLLQTPEWASFKVSQGWQSHELKGVFVLEKKLPMGKSFLYAPEVAWDKITSHPEVSAEGSPANAGSETSSEILRSVQNDSLQIFLQKLQKIAKKSRAIFFRLEILDENNTEIISNLKQNGFVKAFEELQPERRQVIDISKTEEEILSQMKPKGRYNIKIAEKHGVKVQKITEEGLLESVDVFYNLFRETSENQDFSIRPKKYFHDLLFNLYGKRYADLFIATVNGTPVCGLIITYFDGVASYLYGASSKENRQVMGPYLAHWEVIREAKRRGCSQYDLLAIAPGELTTNNKQLTTDNEQESENKVVSRKSSVVSHKYTGITRFKEQFGGEKVEIVGGYDLIYQPFWYKIFKTLEKRRRN